MSACRSCQAPIVWAEHERTGNRMPLDDVIVHTGVRFRLDYSREGGPVVAHLVATDSGEPGQPSHLGSCPDRDKHRRSR